TNQLSSYIPFGNLNPATGAFADASQRINTQDDKIGERIDYYNGLTGRWSGYYHFDDTNFNNPLNASFPGFNTLTNTPAQVFTLNNTLSWGALSVNEVHVSVFRTAVHNGIPTNGFVSLNSLGFVTGPGTLGILPSGPAGYPDVLPKITLTNFNFG